jgi:hypothetical protein
MDTRLPQLKVSMLRAQFWPVVRRKFTAPHPNQFWNSIAEINFADFYPDSDSMSVVLIFETVS